MNYIELTQEITRYAIIVGLKAEMCDLEIPSFLNWSDLFLGAC